MNNLIGDGPPQPDFVVIDEAHHAAAESYRDWLSLFAAYRPDGPKVLGLTATPYRLHEGEITPLIAFGFSKPKVPIFQEVAFRRSFCDLAAQGYLAPFRHIKFDTHLSYKMRMQAGEFSAESLKQLDSPQRNRKIAEYWRDRRSQFGKTLIFAASKDHAKNLAKQFGSDGDYVVSGDDDRKQVIADFRSGRFPVVVNVGIFKEGVDVPDIRTVILARPTASAGLFTQMVGRGSRMAPGKQFFYLVDVHDQLGKYEHYLAGIADLGDRDLALIEAVEKKAQARERIAGLATRDIAENAGALVDLLITPESEILTQFGGWIAFKDADNAPVPVGTLLSKSEYAALRDIAGTTHVLHPTQLTRVEQVQNGSIRIGKCVQALRDGLVGALQALDQTVVQELSSLRSDGATSLGIAGTANLATLQNFLQSVQTRGQALGVQARALGLIENAYVQSPDRFACVAWLRTADGPYAKLLGRSALQLLTEAVALNASNGLKFSDAPILLAKLEAIEPELKSHGPALLSAVESSKQPADFLTLCPSEQTA